jgi:hypothetical protein
MALSFAGTLPFCLHSEASSPNRTRAVHRLTDSTEEEAELHAPQVNPKTSEPALSLARHAHLDRAHQGRRSGQPAPRSAVGVWPSAVRAIQHVRRERDAAVWHQRCRRPCCPASAAPWTRGRGISPRAIPTSSAGRWCTRRALAGCGRRADKSVRTRESISPASPDCRVSRGSPGRGFPADLDARAVQHLWRSNLIRLPEQ